MKHSEFQNFSVYDNQQAGDTYVYLHGLGGKAADGDFLRDAFPNSRIVLIDLPGHGLAKMGKASPDIYELALQLELLFQHYSIEMPTIIGHSLGGQMALLHEITNPGRAKKLLLISPAGLEQFTEMQKQMVISTWQFSNYFSGFMMPFAGTDWLKPSEMPDAEVIKVYMKSMMDRPVRDLLKNVHCDVTVFFGENDLLIPNKMYNSNSPVEFAKKAVAEMPNFKVVGIPMAGHWPMFENRVALVKAISGA